MNLLSYQRMVIGYHGCSEEMVTSVLTKGKGLTHSENDYDWLGKGISFWEHGPQRALEWAKYLKRIRKPAVLGAIINLGNCFDLLDTTHTQLLSSLFPLYRNACAETGVPLPNNLPAASGTATDLVMRRLDCAVINWCLDYLEKEKQQQYHTV